MRVAFAGTPDFSVPPLEALVGAGYDLVGVLTQPDRPKGRGRQVTPSPVKTAALAHGIPVSQPQTLKDEASRAELVSWRPDVLVVVAYGLILPRAALDIPRLGCLNIHASLLPRWRGAARGARYPQARLPEHPRLAIATVAGRRAHPALNTRRRRHYGRDHHAHGRRVGYGSDAPEASYCYFARRYRRNPA